MNLYKNNDENLLYTYIFYSSFGNNFVARNIVNITIGEDFNGGVPRFTSCFSWSYGLKCIL